MLSIDLTSKLIKKLKVNTPRVFCLFLTQTVFASAPNCPVGIMENIRFDSDVLISRDYEGYDNEYFPNVTYIKVDTIEGECYTKMIENRPLLLRAFSAYSFGIQIQPHSQDCLSGYNNFFSNFTLTRE